MIQELLGGMERAVEQLQDLQDDLRATTTPKDEGGGGEICEAPDRQALPSRGKGCGREATGPPRPRCSPLGIPSTAPKMRRRC